MCQWNSKYSRCFLFYNCCENQTTFTLPFVRSAIIKILAADSIGLDLPCFAQGTAICIHTMYINAVAIAKVQSKTRQMKKKTARTYAEYNLFRNRTPHAIWTTWKINIYCLSLILQILFTQFESNTRRKKTFDAFFKRPLKLIFIEVFI